MVTWTLHGANGWGFDVGEVVRTQALGLLPCLKARGRLAARG